MYVKNLLAYLKKETTKADREKLVKLSVDGKEYAVISIDWYSDYMVLKAAKPE